MYSTRQPQHSLKNALEIGEASVLKVINRIVSCFSATDFMNKKLGGQGRVVQVDENMLNFKCKRHRRRSPDKKN